MSHFSRLKTQIVEKEYLLKALSDLGYQYEEGDLNVRGFNGNQAKVEVVIHRPLSYDIGFRRAGDNYEIVADWFGVRGLKQKDFANQVMQRYAYHVTREKLEAQGFSLVEEGTEKGQVRLVLRRMA
jgi:hypothetical protein